MGCNCSRALSSEFLINIFWESLKLRNKPYQDIVDLIRTKKTNTQPIKPNKWLILLQDLIINPDYTEQTTNVFNEALTIARDEYKNEGLLFLSLVLLGQGTETEFVKHFLNTAMTQGGLKDSISILPDKNLTVIKKESLKTFIKYYINLITFLGVKHISCLSDNKQLFEDKLNANFSKENQHKILEQCIFNGINGDEDEDNIDIATFWKDNYSMLKEDTALRESLSFDTK